ncbi:GFA family protein [Collimonas sp. PA-H2]|uniref:GFA family protein n=1 Tax=Collimonas sp. PA-H2 TaxID=1881062 RepID=UPI000BF92C88
MTTYTLFTPLTGGRKCGEIRFRMGIAPIIRARCHCHQCQKVSGSGFRTSAMIEVDHLTILETESQPFHGADQRRYSSNVPRHYHRGVHGGFASTFDGGHHAIRSS